jgi:mono/diheme cytochrome c family protein
MLKGLSVAIAAGVIVAGASMTSSQATTAGPFTAAQVQAGAKTYQAQCSKCHGTNLEGVSAPALRGTGSGLAGDTVSVAYTFISTQMPAGNPASLSNAEYANIVAYILSRNGHAPGSARLTPAVAKSSQLKV